MLPWYGSCLVGSCGADSIAGSPAIVSISLEQRETEYAECKKLLERNKAQLVETTKAKKVSTGCHVC